MTPNTTDECWESFEAKDKFVPLYSHNINKGKKSLWMTAELKANTKDNTTRYGRYMKTRALIDYDNYKSAGEKTNGDSRRQLRSMKEGSKGKQSRITKHFTDMSISKLNYNWISQLERPTKAHK